MPANALAVFAAKAPVEPTAPTQALGNDNDFKNFMDTATHKADTAQKPSEENSAQNQNDNTPAGKTQPHKTKAESRAENNPNPQETSAQVENTSAYETVSKDSLIEDNQVLAAQLQELDINQARFDALLDLLGLNGDADLDALLESLTQALNLNPQGNNDLIAEISQGKGEAVNFLKQAGLSDAEAKNLLNHLQSLQNASAQKGLDKNVNLQAKIDSQTLESDAANAKSSALENSQDGSDEEPNFLAQFRGNAKEAEKTDRSASVDKLNKTQDKAEAPRITTQEPVNEKGAKTSNLSELLNDKNANVLQTESFSDAKGFAKGMETAKTGPDLQIQSPNIAANTAVKAVEASKPILPENLLARGATEAKIINQIANKMTVRTTGGQSEVHIRLDPPSLGTVKMKIITSGDSVRAMIVAENHAVKQVIETNFSQLRDAMGEQGLKLDSFTVTVGGESNPQNPESSPDEEKNNSSFDQTADTDNNPEASMESLFFEDNQSISVIA